MPFSIDSGNILLSASNIIEEKVPINVVKIASGTTEQYAFQGSCSTIKKLWCEGNIYSRTKTCHTHYELHLNLHPILHLVLTLPPVFTIVFNIACQTTYQK